MKTLAEKLKALDDVTAIASVPGNAFADSYMLGMANGLILAQAIMDDGEPAYLTMPESKTVPAWADGLEQAIHKAMGIQNG